MTFEGYIYKAARNKRVAIIRSVIGFVVFLGGWLSIWALASRPTTQDIVLAVWVALMAGTTAYLVGPRRREWGRGSLTGQQVVWDAPATVYGELVRRQRPPPGLLGAFGIFGWWCGR